MKFERIPKSGDFDRLPKDENFIGPLEPNYSQLTQIPEEKRFYNLQKIIQARNPDFMGDAMEFGLTLMQKHQDVRDYSLFHVLNGSTPPPGTPKIDFEGEDSILSFMERYAAEGGYSSKM